MINIKNIHKNTFTAKNYNLKVKKKREVPLIYEEKI